MRYIVVDKSLQGVNKFFEKNQQDNIKAIYADLLDNPKLPQAELVYSLGFIEHFEPAETKKIIKAHFDAVLPGGLVLITFPTPTWLYLIVRNILELLNWWPFHDERPLLEEEVLSEVEKHGTILTKKMNWFIGLTQKIIIARKQYEKND